MGDVNKLSESMIDVAERFADIVDAAQGKGARKGGLGLKWVLLPAAGVTAWVVTGSSGAARRTRKLMGQAKDRATELPDAALFGRVKEVTGLADESQSGGQTRQSTRTQARRRSTGTGSRRKTTSTR